MCIRDSPSPVVPVYAPISGVIVQQNVTQAAAAGVTFSGSATAFTIADLSSVWVICDVFENDIPKIALGQEAKIKLNAYPDKVFIGHISDIGPVLDPAIRTAKVRLEVSNPGMFKVGTVSYTHLDVYKRQQLDDPIRCTGTPLLKRDRSQESAPFGDPTSPWEEHGLRAARNRCLPPKIQIDRQCLRGTVQAAHSAKGP